MGELAKLLKGANTYAQALETLKGKTLVVDSALPSPPRMQVLEAKGDYFVAVWKGKTVEKEFFAPYNMKSIVSLE